MKGLLSFLSCMCQVLHGNEDHCDCNACLRELTVVCTSYTEKYGLTASSYLHFGDIRACSVTQLGLDHACISNVNVYYFYFPVNC